MKKLLLIIIIFILFIIFSYPVSYADSWDRNDKYLYGYFTSLQIIDCLQTRYIYHSPRHKEAFPPAKFIINDKPSRIIPMFLATNLLSLYAADKMPRKWRQRFLGTLTLFEVYAVGRNYCLGVKFYF